jgi:hypothetical protein
MTESSGESFDNKLASLGELGVSRQRLSEWREVRDAGERCNRGFQDPPRAEQENPAGRAANGVQWGIQSVEGLKL